jgi:ferredoxin-NADP reductase/Na+-translocating ferredoxin:NAD+ oxidoreductase RnfD subunit
MNSIDRFLNKITMYRLILYYLTGLLIVAIILSACKVIHYNPGAIILSTVILIAVSWAANEIFVWAFKAHANVESVYISALILALILTPLASGRDVWFLAAAAVVMVASKFIFAVRKKHVFNPVAIAVVITGFVLNYYASWWVGTLWMLPFVIIGGVLIVRKIQRFDLVFSFLMAAVVTIMAVSLINGINVVTVMKQSLIDSPLFFLAFVMLTEPLTTPPTKLLQIWYGAIVGVLFAPQLHVGSVYATPELSLVIGNLFAYIVSPKQKLTLSLKEKVLLAPDTYEFVFASDQGMNFRPGQYLEWTLSHAKPDDRGNRRYFTIASAPSEESIRVGVKFGQPTSSFKKKLLEMQLGDTLMAAQLSGDFTLPNDLEKKFVFIAGGIGITPFVSMIRDALETKQKKDITLLYANRNPEDIAYRDVLEHARTELGMNTVYTLSAVNATASHEHERTGRITAAMIREEVPDFAEREYYISGPNSMVQSFEELLSEIGIPPSHVTVDYFPGF